MEDMSEMSGRPQIKVLPKGSLEKISNAPPVNSFWAYPNCCEDRDVTFHVTARHDGLEDCEAD